ncbi:GTP-binding protein 2-like protein [Leptotrombidium deliense]|uniref:GTP-binding protein 2-like protein n=1 Tax=Leptotrombidium deliense TaxID=299467 RepID=A0A443SQC0_9ACAR|nr:GTP-binding protein 2-like protein [Leptotrombidium deliense]
MQELVGLFDCEEEFDAVPQYLPPECADGNVEYKLKLINPSQSRLEHLVTQMKWRLREGAGEAIYEIGVEDKGLLIGLTDEEVNASLNTLCLMSDKLGATLTVLRERVVTANGCVPRRKVLEVLIRKVPDDQQSIEIRVAVIGNVDVGKSTLLGVLTQGELDNGKGSSRLNLFRHRHEIQSGRTSSISREILGFNSSGSPVTYRAHRTAEEICEASSKLITFIDLAGHQKYLRTTVFGLMGHLPHLAIMVVSAVSGIAGTAREHFGLALALDVPLILVVNKVDIATTDTVSNTVQQIESLLKSVACKKVPMEVNTKDDAITAASCMSESKITPIFTVSCVTGFGVDLLYTFLNVLSPCVSNKEREKLMQQNTEFQIDETFNVSDVGLVVGGLLTSGVIRENDSLHIGPLHDGTFAPVYVSSLHRHKVPCRVVRAGESASLALTGVTSDLSLQMRKGMVISSVAMNPFEHPICLYFQARIHVLFHTTMICPGFQATVHVKNVRQTAVIVAIMGKRGISTNETASVMFKFLKQPEYINPGCRLLFRQGICKGIGHVIQVFAANSKEAITLLDSVTHTNKDHSIVDTDS